MNTRCDPLASSPSEGQAMYRTTLVGIAIGGLSQNTHRLNVVSEDLQEALCAECTHQVASDVMTPPSTGPSAPATASNYSSDDTTSYDRKTGKCQLFQYHQFLQVDPHCNGDNSGKQMMVIEYTILPPTPQSVRNTISWFMFSANLEPKEKATKTRNPNRTTSRRP